MTSIFHAGELAVQARAGVQEMASRVARSIGSTIPLAAQEFLCRQPMVIIGSRDERGRVWASVLTGVPGFMQALDERTLTIDTRPVPGDPLSGNLEVSDQVGIIVIEPATRRRMRLNGSAMVRPDGAIEVRTQQVYSNCPKYIQARQWTMKDAAQSFTRLAQSDNQLSSEQQLWISKADTFFIASSHPEGGLDASHRGGNPGFVRILNDRSLVWPDYSGNKMFQTLGNIAVDTHAGLLFIDFDRDRTLQLTGRVEIIWDLNRVSEFAGAERILEFHLDQAIEIENATGLRWNFTEFSSLNPAD